MLYLIVIEETQNNYAAYVPDLPGCAATGETIDKIMQNMKEAIKFHIAGLAAENIEIPEPMAKAAYIYIDGE